jgi:flagellar hook-length control protein FliK
MMPEMVLMPQPVKVQAAKTSAPTKPVKMAMQKAASQSDTPAQAAPASTSQSKPTGEKPKPTDQPANFQALLMAQIAMPTEEATAQVPAVTPKPVAESNQVVTTVTPTQEILTPQTTITTAEDTAQNTQVPVTQEVMPTEQESAPTSALPMVTAPVVVTGTQVASPAVEQVADTTKAVAGEVKVPVKEVMTKAVGRQPEMVKSNPIPLAAQTPAMPSVKAEVGIPEGDSGTVATPSEVPAPQTAALPKTPTQAVPNKPALAEALANRAATQQETKPATPPVRPSQAPATVPAATQANANSQAVYHNPNIIAATVQQPAATVLPSDTVVVTPPSTATSSAPKTMTTQLVDGIRSIAASGTGSDKTMTIALNPPELGRVVVKMNDEGGSITAVLRVENPVTRADIEQSVPSIVRSLEQAGIQVKRIDVLPSDPIPQESANRQYDFQQGTLNQQREGQHSSQANHSGQATATGNGWQDLQPVTAAASSQQSSITDSGLNFYM